MNFPRHLPGVIKYLNRIKAAICKHGAPEVRRMAAAAMHRALPRLGPVLPGSLAGGTAFGAAVTINYWLVNPCASGEGNAQADNESGSDTERPCAINSQPLDSVSCARSPIILAGNQVVLARSPGAERPAIYDACASSTGANPSAPPIRCPGE